MTEHDEFERYPIGVEEDPTTGGWIVIDGDTWRVIALRHDKATAEAICRKANRMTPKAGDEQLLEVDPQGKEFGPNYEEPGCAIL